MREPRPAGRSREGPRSDARHDRDRGTATALSYVLTLGITAILISGLLVAAGGTVESQREATTAEALEVVGQQLASRLAAADRLAEAGATDLEVRGGYPDAIAGSTYTVTIDGGDPPDPTAISLAATGVRVSVTVSVRTHTPVADASLAGGDVEVVLAGGRLEVRSR